MSFEVNFTLQAVRDIESHSKSGNKGLMAKLLDELEERPETGTGKP
jgi:toxin YoeB